MKQIRNTGTTRPKNSGHGTLNNPRPVIVKKPTEILTLIALFYKICPFLLFYSFEVFLSVLSTCADSVISGSNSRETHQKPTDQYSGQTYHLNEML